MDHGLDIERRVRDGLTRHQQEAGHPAGGHQRLALHARVARPTAHDALLCIQTGKQLADPDRFRFDGSGYYLKTADEMRAIDCSDLWAEGCRNTLLVAEKVDPAGMFEFRNLMPTFPVPEGETEETLVPQGGLAGHGPALPRRLDEEHREQAEYEMDVILPDGVPLLLPRRRRLHHVGQEQRHPGRPGPWLARRARWSRTRWASPTSTRCRTA